MKSTENLKNNEQIIFEIKPAKNAAIYFCCNAIIRALIIFAWMSAFIGVGIIVALLKKTINFNLPSVNDAVSYINLLPHEARITMYAFVLIILSGILILCFPLIFSKRQFNKMIFFFTNIRCYINSTQNSAQIDYSNIECVTLSQILTEKWFGIANIFILDKTTANDDKAWPRTQSLNLQALNEEDAKTILDFFKSQQIKTATKYSSSIIDARLSGTLSDLWNKRRR